MPSFSQQTTPAGVSLLAPVADEFAALLTPLAIDFIAKLHRTFDGRRRRTPTHPPGRAPCKGRSTSGTPSAA